MWGRGTEGGGREGGRKSRRASGILNVAISKVLNRSFISPHMSYNTFRRAAPITATEMKPRTIVFGKNTSSFEYAPLITTRIIKCCCQENICASYSGFWVQMSAWNQLIVTNASVIFRVSVDKLWNNTLNEFVVLMEKWRKVKYSKRIKKEIRDGKNWVGKMIKTWLSKNELKKNNNKVYLLDTSHLSSFLHSSRYQKDCKWVKKM